MEILAKRMLFFTKVILTFLVIMVLIFLNFLDLRESNRNKTYLNLINKVAQKGDDALRFKNYELERVKFLQDNDSSSATKHINARNELVNLLKVYGANFTKGTKGGGDAENRFVVMTVPERHVQGPGEGTVASALDFFLAYASDDTASILTGFDSKILKKQLDSISNVLSGGFNGGLPKTKPLAAGNGNVAPDDNGGNAPVVGDGTNPYGITDNKNSRILFSTYEFSEAHIQDNNLVLVLGQNMRNSNAQGAAYSFSLHVPAQLKKINFPSTLHFAGFDSVLIKDLSSSKQKQQDLKNLYGFYDLSMVDKISVEEINKNNDAVSILGFDISRKWFPVALLITLVIIYILLFETIKKAQQQKLKIITNYNSEQVLDFLIDKKWIRLFLWIATPVLLGFFIFYCSLIRYSNLTYGYFAVACLLCFIIGLLAYKKSLVL